MCKRVREFLCLRCGYLLVQGLSEVCTRCGAPPGVSGPVAGGRYPLGALPVGGSVVVPWVTVEHLPTIGDRGRMTRAVRAHAKVRGWDLRWSWVRGGLRVRRLK